MASPSDSFDDLAEKQMAKAVASGDVGTVRDLLASKQVSPTASGRNGLGWLQLAIITEHHEVLDVLLQAGALGDPAGKTTGHAMYQATVADDPYWLKTLHEAGASLDNRGGGELLLLSAARSKLPGRLEYFIKNGADLDAETLMGDTAAVSSATTGNYPAVLTLLDAGASPWTVSPRGHTIGFWLERRASKPAWNPESAAAAQRTQVIAKLKELGVPHPPPAPEEVLTRKQAGQWGSAPVGGQIVR